jgi:cytochrome c553
MKRVAVVLVALLLPGAASASTGSQLFANEGCGGCHTLSAASAYGQGGPNLDQLQPSAAAVAAQVESGGGGMPSFGGRLSISEIDALAAFVSTAAGGGSSGALPPPAVWVRRLQTELAHLGYFHHAATGVYGPITTAAVKRFQRAHGLAVDGKWGPKSQAALKRTLG